MYIFLCVCASNATVICCNESTWLIWVMMRVCECARMFRFWPISCTPFYIAFIWVNGMEWNRYTKDRSNSFERLSFKLLTGQLILTKFSIHLKLRPISVSEKGNRRKVKCNSQKNAVRVHGYFWLTSLHFITHLKYHGKHNVSSLLNCLHRFFSFLSLFNLTIHFSNLSILLFCLLAAIVFNLFLYTFFCNTCYSHYWLVRMIFML